MSFGLFVGVGCRDAVDTDIVYQDSYTAMAEVCRWDDYRGMYASYGEAIELPNSTVDIPPYPSEACVDQVLSDLNVDVEGLLDADGLDDPYETALYDSGALGYFNLDSVLAGVRGLVLMESGEVHDYWGQELVADEYLDVLSEVAAQTGVSSLNAVQYNFVTSVIDEVVFSSGEACEGDTSACYARASRTLYVQAPWYGDVRSSAMLVHEAGHVFAETNHLPCNSYISAESACDEQYDRVIAFATSNLAMKQGAYSGHHILGDFSHEGWVGMSRINEFHEDGEMLPEWEAAWERVFPPQY